MPLSVIDLYRDYLPRTNCGDCGYRTCMAFAGMVVSSCLPLGNCPHIPQDRQAAGAAELEKQYSQGKWLKKDMAAEALEWARQRASSMAIQDLPARIGGTLSERDGKPALILPFFNTTLTLASNGIVRADGSTVDLWDQVVLYNHLAQGGSALPSGTMKSLKEFPNTVSKIKTMKERIEIPVRERYAGRVGKLASVCTGLGADDVKKVYPSADLAMQFHAFPRVPMILLFWDADPADEYEAQAHLLFDETITQHLDLESILFLSEKLAGLLLKEHPETVEKN